VLFHMTNIICASALWPMARPQAKFWMRPVRFMGTYMSQNNFLSNPSHNTYDPRNLNRSGSNTKNPWKQNGMSEFPSKLQHWHLRASSTSQDPLSSAKLSGFPEEHLSNLYTVMVTRNRNSMSFREGNPLIFSGAISYTIQNGSKNLSSIQMGSLVKVVVAGPSSGELMTSFLPQSTKPKGGNSQKKGGNLEDAKLKTAPHFNLVDDNVSTNASLLDALRQDLSQSQTIGFGVYNPHSMYRVRMLCNELLDPILHKNVQNSLKTNACQQEALRIILTHKIKAAVKCRQMLGLPSAKTDTFRLVNGEGDGLSGLVIDILGMKVAVIMSSASWCQIYKTAIQAVLQEILIESYPTSSVETIWRTTPSRLQQDGYNAPLHENGTQNEMLERSNEVVLIRENDINYQTFPWAGGQKTGFYCDQRDNKLLIGQYCAGKRVLDLCCYSGGFALHAAKQGASMVIGVDSSQEAVDCATANARLNNITADDGTNNSDTQVVISFVRADVTQFMKDFWQEIQSGQQDYVDVIILDPPKLAPNLSGLDRASRKYLALNRDAIKLIDPVKGGLILTHTCSGAMTQRDGGAFFVNTIQSAAVTARRQISLMHMQGAASCHTISPAGYPGGAYLTSALFYVSPVVDGI